MKIFYPLLVGLVVVFSPVAFAGEPGMIETAQMTGAWNNCPAARSDASLTSEF